jgi:membrane protein implicated in regulation of membrane protease activity
MTFLIFLLARKLMKKPAQTGKERLIDRIGKVQVSLTPSGIVYLSGEKWSAELVPGEEHAPAGTRVRVVAVDGLTLQVQRDTVGPSSESDS